MTKTKLDQAYERHEEKITELLSNYKTHRMITYDMYIRMVVIRRLLRNFMADEEVEEHIHEYRSKLDNKHTLNESDSSGSFLDGMGDETGHQGKESRE